MRLGLIEAQGSIFKVSNPVLRYPRRMRLGLIEASAGNINQSLSIASIRGACASASLKPLLGQGGLRMRRCIRGACASASLKPRQEARPEALRRGIRGACASASLKPCRQAPCQEAAPCIRGACASASLKPSLKLARNSHALLRIRGACASASLKLGPGSAQIHYKPEYPRRMRLGLIEAYYHLEQSVDDVRRIRGACASASLKPPAPAWPFDLPGPVSEAHAPRPH